MTCCCFSSLFFCVYLFFNVYPVTTMSTGHPAGEVPHACTTQPRACSCCMTVSQTAPCMNSLRTALRGCSHTTGSDDDGGDDDGGGDDDVCGEFNNPKDMMAVRVAWSMTWSMSVHNVVNALLERIVATDGLRSVYMWGGWLYSENTLYNNCTTHYTTTAQHTQQSPIHTHTHHTNSQWYLDHPNPFPQPYTHKFPITPGSLGTNACCILGAIPLPNPLFVPAAVSKASMLPYRCNSVLAARLPIPHPESPASAFPER